MTGSQGSTLGLAFNYKPGRPRAGARGGRRLRFQAEVNIDRTVFTLQHDSSRLLPWLRKEPVGRRLGGGGWARRMQGKWPLCQVALAGLAHRGLGREAWAVSNWGPLGSTRHRRAV